MDRRALAPAQQRLAIVIFESSKSPYSQAGPEAHAELAAGKGWRVQRVRRSLLSVSAFSVLERDACAPLTGGDTPDGVLWRRAVAEDFENWDARSIPLQAHQVRGAVERLASGSVCLIALHQGRVVHVCWLNLRALDSPPFWMELGPGWAYFSRSRTAEAFRSMGLHKAGLRQRIELAKSLGVQRVVALIDETNVVSLANVGAMGFAATGVVREVALVSRWRIPVMPRHVRARIQAPAPELAGPGARTGA
jgi:hypothetical protein